MNRRTHSAYSKTESQVQLIRSLPFLLALATVFLFLASGTLDKLILTPGTVNPPQFPGDFPSEIPVLKASLESSREPVKLGKLVYTSHTVTRGETLSRLAYKYGLTPSTLTSANGLSGAANLKPGDILIVPYTDGSRVQPEPGERISDLAERFGVSVESIQSFPGSTDLFIPGYAADAEAYRPVGENQFRYPVQGRVLTAYGESVDTLTDIPFISDGIDLSAESGAPVKAARSGKVILTGSHSSYGLYVMISHSGGWKSFYGYLSRIDVAPGDLVSGGSTVIGRAGDSGVARSPRLHFVLFEGNRTVDPLDYLY